MTRGGAPLVLEDVWFAHGERPVLEGVDLELPAGTVLGLTGPNGSGKTTLLRVALGLLPAQRGTVRWFGRPLRAGQVPGPRVAYVPQVRQGSAEPCPLTVWELVASGRARRARWRRPGTGDRRAVEEALHVVGLAGLEGRRLAELSGGQRRLAMVARALAAEAEVLVLDEPTAGVDVDNRERLYAWLARRCADGGRAALVVSHDLEGLRRWAARVVSIGRRPGPQPVRSGGLRAEEGGRA